MRGGEVPQHHELVAVRADQLHVPGLKGDGQGDRQESNRGEGEGQGVSQAVRG